MTSRHVPIGIKTSPQAVDWATLDHAWARIGEHEVFESVWMNDHLIDISGERNGASLEALTAMAALVHRVPGKWVGGRFIVGLGAGWHEGEHAPFGIPMPPMPERFDRFESAVHVLRALWSEAASAPPGVTRPDPFYPLIEATNEPAPLTPGGPPLWLGGQKRRGIALAAAVADGWALPTVVALGAPSDLTYYSEKRDALLAALEATGRDPATFDISAQVPTGTTAEDRRWALGQALEAVERGATHVILGMPPRLGAAGVDVVAREVAQPFRDAIG